MRVGSSIRLALFACGMLQALVGCASHGKKNDSAGKPFGPTGIPPELRAKQGVQGTPVAPGGNVPPGPNQPQFTPEEEIVFTDPDAQEQGGTEISEILNKAKKRDSWELSETLARKRAARDGKPLLIWFTDSKQSPMCKALSQELFSLPDFEKWAVENTIRLRVDASQSLDDPGLSLDQRESQRVDVRRYVADLKKRYKVLGHPSVLMLNPSGEVIGRYRGYKRGQAEFFWGQLKHALEVSNRVHGELKQSLAGKGYRDWTNRQGKKVFARLVRYQDGLLQLAEPDGTLSQTREDQLCDEDRDWISARKRERGIE